MPYRRSAARIEFENRIKGLKETVRKAALKARPVPSDIADLVFHAAIFECSAGIEEYFKNNLESWIYQLRHNSKTMSDIPDRILKVIFLSESRPVSEKYITSNSEKDAISKLDFNAKHFDFPLANKKINIAIQAKAIYSRKKYPSPENINNLFYRIGIDKIFHKLSHELRRDAESLIKSFNDVRTAIAHQSPPPMTAEDVKRHLDNVLLVVKCIDRVLYRYVAKSSGDVCWA